MWRLERENLLFCSLCFLAVLLVHALDFRSHAVNHQLLLIPQSLALLKARHQQIVVSLKVGQLF